MDLEMTGLDPDHDVIVEIATIVTDDELEIVADPGKIEYYRDDNDVHHVPKRRLEDVLLAEH